MKLAKLHRLLECVNLQIVEDEIYIRLVNRPSSLGYAFSDGDGDTAKPSESVSFLITDIDPYIEWFEK